MSLLNSDSNTSTLCVSKAAAAILTIVFCFFLFFFQSSWSERGQSGMTVSFRVSDFPGWSRHVLALNLVVSALAAAAVLAWGQPDVNPAPAHVTLRCCTKNITACFASFLSFHGTYFEVPSPPPHPPPPQQQMEAWGAASMHRDE